MNQPSELNRILLAMGNASDEIAATLRAAGVRGVRNTVRFLNPIMRYCQSHIRLDSYALDVMQPGMLRMQTPDCSADSPLPTPVSEFLKAFDRGDYPDLELPVSGASGA